MISALFFVLIVSTALLFGNEFSVGFFIHPSLARVRWRWFVLLERRPKNEIDNIADILFVGHAFEAFFRESDDGAQAAGELTV